jgi:SAM-dependent methyltransferase
MGLNERAPYEIEEHWKYLTLSPAIEEKARVLGRMLPRGPGRILDLGCGNGLITNCLARDYRIVGLDWSWEALKHVTTPRICATATALPLRPGDFSVILSSELLEHLRETDLRATVRGLLRLDASHILITVPNNENLCINELRCPACGHVFNASYHQRSFSAESLAALFTRYRLVQVQTGGMPVRSYPGFLLRLRQRVGRRWFQVPESRTVVCPRCQNREFPRVRYNPISIFCDALNRLISRRHPYWLYVLLERE